MNIIKSKTLKSILFLVFLVFFALNSVQAATTLLKPSAAQETNFLANRVATTNMEDIQIGQLVAIIIKAFLGLLGIVFLILILIAGWQYFNARGDDEKINKALDTIKNSIIGLIIIIGAYAITYFVFSNLP